jgi:hypothetical protein
MYTGIGRSLGTDYFRIADQLTGEELSYLQRTRDFVDNDVLPVIKARLAAIDAELAGRTAARPGLPGSSRACRTADGHAG